MSKFTLHATSDDPEFVLRSLSSVIADELEQAVRSLPDCDGDVSSDDYTVRHVGLQNHDGEMEITAQVVVQE